MPPLAIGATGGILAPSTSRLTVARHQLNLRLDAALQARLAAAAAAAGLPPSTLARHWLQERLDASTPPPPDPVDTRLARIEERLDALERPWVEAQAALDREVQQKPGAGKNQHTPSGGPPLGTNQHTKGACEGPSHPRPVTGTRDNIRRRLEPSTGTTTAELAKATGTNRAGWNNWAAKATIGAVREHSTAGRWRLIGKTPATGGGPPRWLWERAG